MSDPITTANREIVVPGALCDMPLLVSNDMQAVLLCWGDGSVTTVDDTEGPATFHTQTRTQRRVMAARLTEIARRLRAVP